MSLIILCEGEAEDADGAVVALVLCLVDAGVASGDEAALYHNAARGRIVDKMAADERCDVCGVAYVFNH